jgi:hypothetical protein
LRASSLPTTASRSTGQRRRGSFAPHPSPSRDPSGRRRVQVRNALWSPWLRRPLGDAARQTAHLAALALHQRGASSGLLLAMLGLPWVLRERRPVPEELEAALRTLSG